MVNLTIIAGDCSNDIRRSLRDMPPAHYTLEINSFSDLQKMVTDSKTKRYESQTFEVGGYKWKLCLYPNGDEERNGNGYISMYLVIVETDGLTLCWDACVKFKLFVYDHIHDTFLKIQDVGKRVWRFDRKKKECGFPQLISQTDFHDPKNGYLRCDKCIFGAEIAMCSLGKGEVVSPIKNFASSYTWKLSKFSTSYVGSFYYSEVFTMAGYKWKLNLYPKGEADVGDKYLSLYLLMEETKRSERVYADFELLIIDQKNDKDRRIAGSGWFTIGGGSGLGFPDFMSLEEFEDESKGFLVADCVRIEAKITGISAINIIS